MTHLHVWHDSFTCVTWLIYMCDMTHLHVWHDSFTCVIWLIYMCDMTHLHVWHDSFTRVPWLIYMCDITHLYAWHDSSIVLHTCDMTHSHTNTRVKCAATALLSALSWVMTHSHVWHDSSTCVTWLIYMCFAHVTWLIYICDMTHLHAWHDSSIFLHTCDMTHSQANTRVKCAFTAWLSACCSRARPCSKRRRVMYTVFHRRGAFSRGTERRNPQNDGRGRIFWRNLVFSSGAAECAAPWLLLRSRAGCAGKKFSNFGCIVVLHSNLSSELAFENFYFLRWLLRSRDCDTGKKFSYMHIYMRIICIYIFMRIICIYIRNFHIYMHIYVQPIASGVSFDLILESQSPWSFFNGTCQKRPRELDHRFRFEKEAMTLRMQ